MKIYLSKESELQAQIAELKEKLKERTEDVEYWIKTFVDENEVRICDHCGRKRWMDDMHPVAFDQDLSACSEDCAEILNHDAEQADIDWQETRREISNRMILDAKTK